MKRRLNIPKFKEKVFIICEGVGDKIYLEKVISFYETKYDICVISSGGKDKIVNKLREVLIHHPHNEYYIFIDTDANPKEVINNYQKQMKQEGINHVDKIYCVNPIIEYLYLITQTNKHPTNFYTKNKYAKLFEKHFGIYEYSGTQKQYEEMAKRIDKDSFKKSKALISVDIYHSPSSTITLLIDKIIQKW